MYFAKKIVMRVSENLLLIKIGVDRVSARIFIILALEYFIRDNLGFLAFCKFAYIYF